VSPEGGEHRVVSGLGDVLRASYLPSGILVYAQAGGLMAVRFDVQEARPLGDPVLVLKDLASVPDQGNAYFALADNGTLAYLPGTPTGNLELVWVDRQGRVEPAVDELQGYSHPRLAPQDKQLVVTVGSEVGIRRIWIYDLQRGSRAVLSMEGNAASSTLTPDGERMYFSSNVTGRWNLYSAPLDASSPPQIVLDRDNEQWSGSSSPDGQAFAFYDVRPESGRDIYVLTAGQSEPEPFIVTPFNERAPRFSRDGRWIAYVSNESGRDEVYVESYTVRGRKWTVSSNGGAEPRWSRDGSELFYRMGNQMLAVDVELGESFSASRPHVLFDGHFDSGVAGNPNYDVSSDGERFLMIRRSEEAIPNTINVVLNWSEDLQLK
jgi:Tol biopolymer transport system component